MRTQPRIVVVGSFMMDLMSRTPRLPVPGETVMGGPFQMGPGGKGSNQAVAAARLGADVSMVVSLGRDYFGDVAYNNLVQEGVDVGCVKRVDNVSTGAALIMVDEKKGENMIVVAPGSNNELGPEDVDRAKGLILGSHCMLVQLEIPLSTVEYAIGLAHDNNVGVILNPAPGRPLPDELFQKVDVLTPNESEASAITGQPVVDVNTAGRAARELLARGCRNVVITLGAAGALAANGDGVHLVSGFNVKTVDTTGAGDAFNGALAVALAEGQSLLDAVRFANAAGALCVTKVGTAPAMPSRREVQELLAR
ncbi:MAG: ribokinase [Bacillota bacterium]|nr:ribokinase [Bacillota bacterium]